MIRSGKNAIENREAGVLLSRDRQRTCVGHQGFSLLFLPRWTQRRFRPSD